jgi:SAM-dependent methyltransferase
MKVPCPVCSGVRHTESGPLGGFRVVRCDRCTHRYAPDAMELPVDYDVVYETPEYYEAQIKDIDSEGALRSHRSHGTYRYFFEEVAVPRGATLLDVGCGVGRFLHAAHQSGLIVSGIDVSALAIRIGSARAPFPMRMGTVQDAAGSGLRYDCVTAFEVLEHLSRPLEGLRAMKDLLVPSGRIFVTVPNGECETVRQTERKDWLPPVHRSLFSRRSLAELGRRAGLSSVECGSVRSDPFPREAVARMRWLARRVAGRRSSAPGLWMKGRP